MVITIDAWSQDVTNRKVWDSPPFQYNQTNAECTYLWRDFLIRVVGAPWNAGVAAGVGTSGSHAYQLWTQFGQSGNNDNRVAPQHLDRIPRAQGGRRGDAIIWQPNSGWTYTDGHVAVLDEILPDGRMRVWSQNVPYAAPTRHEILSGVALNGIYGFLRPKNLTDPNPNPTPIPEEDMSKTLIYRAPNGWQFVANVATGLFYPLPDAGTEQVVRSLPGFLDDGTRRDLNKLQMIYLGSIINEATDGSGKASAMNFVNANR